MFEMLIENHHCSGKILHYICIFNRKSKTSWHLYCNSHCRVPSTPVERTLLVSGVLEAALISKKDGGRRVVTEHLGTVLGFDRITLHVNMTVSY